MIIKFSDKFDSIFYAVLLNNLEGYVLVSKNIFRDLFFDEEAIDIDQMNWPKILQAHNEKFGAIKWFNNENSKFIKFSEVIEDILIKNDKNRYFQAINLIKLALKFGLIASEVNLFIDNRINSRKIDYSFKQKQLAI